MISLYTYFFTNLGMPYARTEYWMLYRTQELKTTFKDPKHGFYKQEHKLWLTTPSIRLDRQTWKLPASWAFCLSTHAITCPRLNSDHGCHHGPGRPGLVNLELPDGHGWTAVDRQAMNQKKNYQRVSWCPMYSFLIHEQPITHDPGISWANRLAPRLQRTLHWPPIASMSSWIAGIETQLVASPV